MTDGCTVTKKKTNCGPKSTPNQGNEFGSCSNSFDGGKSGELELSDDVSKMMIRDGFAEIQAFENKNISQNAIFFVNFHFFGKIQNFAFSQNLIKFPCFQPICWHQKQVKNLYLWNFGALRAPKSINTEYLDVYDSNRYANKREI